MKKRNVLLGSMVLIAALMVTATLLIMRQRYRSGNTKGMGTPVTVAATPAALESPPLIAYKAVASMRIPLEQNELVLWISTDPENFVRGKMILLAQHLNHDFPNEPRMRATIFDSEVAARNYNPAGGSYYLSKELERGEYALDRAKGRESINFSSGRGKPVDEIKIALNGTSAPVVKKRD